MKNSKFKSIADTNILSDKQLDSVEAGACNSGCKPSCQQGNSGHKGQTITVGYKGWTIKVGSKEVTQVAEPNI